MWVHARQELTPAAVVETHARAGHGDADAQYELGIMYAEGRDVPQNDAVAFAWYRQAAEQGVAKAQFNVGLMYSSGRGVPRDEAEAVTWYQQAAAQGLAEAQVNLGVRYAIGRGVPQVERARDRGTTSRRRAETGARLCESGCDVRVSPSAAR